MSDNESENRKCVCNINKYCKNNTHKCVCYKCTWCKSDEHICVCDGYEKQDDMCKSSNHNCVCWNTSLYCKSNAHKCICKKVGKISKACMSSDHTCLCPNVCPRLHRHICICPVDDDSPYCRSNQHQHCTCDYNKNCRVKIHTCICQPYNTTHCKANFYPDKYYLYKWVDCNHKKVHNILFRKDCKCYECIRYYGI